MPAKIKMLFLKLFCWQNIIEQLRGIVAVMISMVWLLGDDKMIKMYVFMAHTELLETWKRATLSSVPISTVTTINDA